MLLIRRVTLPPPTMQHSQEWGSPSASDPRAKNTGQRATKETVLTSQSLSPWCDCRRLGSTLASWRWQDINVGNSLWRRALLQTHAVSFLEHSRFLLNLMPIPLGTANHWPNQNSVLHIENEIFAWTFWQETGTKTPLIQARSVHNYVQLHCPVQKIHQTLPRLAGAMNPWQGIPQETESYYSSPHPLWNTPLI